MAKVFNVSEKRSGRLSVGKSERKKKNEEAEVGNFLLTNRLLTILSVFNETLNFYLVEWYHRLTD